MKQPAPLLCELCDSEPCEEGRTSCKPCRLSGEGYEDGARGARPKAQRNDWYMDGYRQGRRDDRELRERP